jgi:hypothetical protein
MSQKEPRYFGHWLRTAEQKSLHLGTAQLPQSLPLLLSLYTLGRRGHGKTSR